MFDRVDHIGIAVTDLEAAVALYSGTFGTELVHRETIDAHGIDAALLTVGESHLELLGAVGPDTLIGRYLASHGPGLHHVAYGVADIDETLATLRARAVELLDTEPRTGIRGSRIAFLHPRATGGVLTEIVQAAA